MKWKNIVGYEEYEISDTGLVKKNGKLIKPFDNKGYERVSFPDRKKKLVHRIVAEHFIPTEDLTLQVNHKDGNKKNNNVENLEWVTCTENVRHAVRTIEGRRQSLSDTMSTIGKKYGKQNALKTRKPVQQLTLEGALIKTFDSAREASKELGIGYRCISQCCLGQRKTYKGFLWKFATNKSQTTIERVTNRVE